MARGAPARSHHTCRDVVKDREEVGGEPGESVEKREVQERVDYQCQHAVEWLQSDTIKGPLCLTFKKLGDLCWNSFSGIMKAENRVQQNWRMNGM